MQARTTKYVKDFFYPFQFYFSFYIGLVGKPHEDANSYGPSHKKHC